MSNKPEKKKSKVGTWLRSLFFVTDGKEPRLLTFNKRNATKSVLAALMSIVAGLLVGFIIMLLIAATSKETTFADAFEGLGVLLSGPFKTMKPIKNFGDMLFYSAPLIMCGLSVAIAFKTGLFNIGAPGQYLMGTMGSLLVALSINTGGGVPGFFVWLLALVVGMLLGFIWGAIPGLFKALFGVNEVIVCIMTNWIAANVVTWVFSGMKNLINTASGKSGYLIKTAVTGNGTPSLGLGKLFNNSYLDISIFIAIAFAIVIYIIINKTTFGYELKACGSNKFASKYAGMNEKRNIILSMAIAGGLAAVGGSLYYLNPSIEFVYKSAYSALPSEGFNGIPVALLANSNPIGVIFSGVFIKYLASGGQNLSGVGNYNPYVSDVIIAVIIYFAGFSRLMIELITRRQKKLTEKVNAKIASQTTGIVSEKGVNLVETKARNNDSARKDGGGGGGSLKKDKNENKGR